MADRVISGLFGCCPCSVGLSNSLQSMPPAGAPYPTNYGARIQLAMTCQVKEKEYKGVETKDSDSS